jgi:hypothetical protein
MHDFYPNLLRTGLLTQDESRAQGFKTRKHSSETPVQGWRYPLSEIDRFRFGEFVF